MDRILKERLVGAAVLMAAAVVLIPEMLSGPDREPGAADERASATSNDAPIKTYTIDLDQSPGTPVASGAVDERAPPPEQLPTPAAAAPQPAADARAKPETPSASSSSPPAPSPTPSSARAAGSRPVVEPPTSAGPPPSAAAPAPLASGGGAPKTGWAVQVGSFAKAASAERLAQQLQTQGRDAFVMPVKSGATTLYRVRIGPTKDRASAEGLLRDVKSSAPGAAIVAHP